MAGGHEYESSLRAAAVQAEQALTSLARAGGDVPFWNKGGDGFEAIAALDRALGPRFQAPTDLVCEVCGADDIECLDWIRVNDNAFVGGNDGPSEHERARGSGRGVTIKRGGGSNMQNVLYRRVVIPTREATDGETAAAVLVTMEINGFAVWTESFEFGTQLVDFRFGIYARELAIEQATNMVACEELEQRIAAEKAERARKVGR